MNVPISARCWRINPTPPTLILMVLLGLAACMPANKNQTEDKYKTVVLRPKAERYVCESGMTLEVAKGDDGGIVITADGLDEEYVTREDAWKILPIYMDPLTGVPELVEVVPEKLSPPELMLLDGFCCRSRGRDDKYRHIKPLEFAVLSIDMMWNSYGTLPSGDFGLLFPGSPPTDPRADMFWALKERQWHANAVVFFNPLRGSVIRVNPPEEKSPGDIYLEPLELSDSQLSEIEPFIARRKAMPSPAFLMTVYGSEGKPIIRGVWFIQKLGAHRVILPTSKTDSASDESQGSLPDSGHGN